MQIQFTQRAQSEYTQRTQRFVANEYRVLKQGAVYHPINNE